MLYTLHTAVPHPTVNPGGPPRVKALDQHKFSVSHALVEENPGLCNLTTVLLPAVE